MCNKLIFRGANPNHQLKAKYEGMTLIALMTEEMKDTAIKYLFDKKADPHITFGPNQMDACDIAKQNGLVKRFFPFTKCPKLQDDS